MSESSLLAAYSYTKSGYAPVPVPRGSKGPVKTGWQKLRLTEQDLADHFNRPTNIGVLLGDASDGLVDIDLDCEEAVELARDFLPATDAETGRASRPGSHWWYRSPGAATRQFRDPVTGEMILELRSTGAQTLVGPSVHPSGDRYDVLEGRPRAVPADELLDCAKELFKTIVAQRHGSEAAAGLTEAKPAAPSLTIRDAAVTEGTSVRRAAAYLDKMQPSISGQGGHDRAYAAATVLVHGFELEPGVALDLLKTDFNPRCEPPWSDEELEHKVSEAATKAHDKPRGWLLRPETPADYGAGAPMASEDRSQPEDPGPLSEDLLHVPGFVGDVMEVTLTCAPYPSRVLALTGALALQAFLAGRAVRDESDSRPNVYLLALAHSGAGKDMPRRVNAMVLREAGLEASLAQQIASGEGLEDSLAATPSMLLQTDEIDAMLQSIKASRDGRYESLMAAMLTVYTSSSSVYARRRKAGVGDPVVIDQPNLVLFGTAIPTHYYNALSDRMLTNGLFSRTLVFESGTRGQGQTAKVPVIPDSVLEAARWWSNEQRRQGFDGEVDPRTVYATSDASTALAAFQSEMDTQYDLAAGQDDAVGAAVWSRANESARKLALLYAVSERHEQPTIGEDAVTWATRVVRHQVNRMLFMVSEHAADNPFEQEASKVRRHLRAAPGHELSRSALLRKLRCPSPRFDELLGTLQERGDVVCSTRGTGGRSATVYSLPVQEGETSVKEGGG